MAQLGRVTRIDHRARQAEIITTGLARPVKATYGDARRPPPPLGTVAIDQAAHAGWVIRDELSVREIVLHEDFGIVSRIGTVLFSDTSWAIGDGGFGATVTQDGAAGGTGVALLSTTATNTDFVRVAKDANPLVLEADFAYWVSAKYAPAGVQNNRIHAVGLFDLVGLVTQASIGFDTGAMTTDHITDGTNRLAIPHTPSMGAFQTVDMVVLPGICIVGWVDGDGPYTLQSGIPAAGAQLAPYVYVSTLEAVAKYLYADWVHIERFTNPTHPERLFDLRA